MKYFLSFLLFFTTPTLCDTVHFKNGNKIDVQTVQDHVAGDESRYKLVFSNNGFMIVRKSEVTKIEKNNRDAFKN